MIKEKICIICPRGCMLKYEYKDEEIQITENQCGRGPIYLKQELIQPKRMLTTTIKIKNGNLNVLPVHAQEYVNKEDVQNIITKLKKIELVAPIKCNDIIVEQVDGIKVKILASKNILEV